MVRAVSFLFVCLFTLLGTIFFITERVQFSFWCGIAFLISYIPYFSMTFLSPRHIVQVPDVTAVSLKLVLFWYGFAFIATTLSVVGYINSLIYLGQMIGEGKRTKLIMLILFPAWMLSWMSVLFHLIISLNIQLTLRARSKYRAKLRKRMLEEMNRRKD